MYPVRTVAPVQPALTNSNSQQQLGMVEEDEYIDVEETSSPPANRPKRVRSTRTPEVLDIDLKSGDMPFEEFVQQKNPDSDADKYLVIAAWLKEHRDMPTIGQDHIYTCYRAMRWGIPRDMGSSFRNGKRDGKFKSAGRGLYAINHIGLDMVDKMDQGG